MTPISALLALVLAAQDPAEARPRTGVLLRSDAPAYEVTLPLDYEIVPSESPTRYLRASGPEPWAKVSLSILAADRALPQPPQGLTSAELLALVPPPPDAKWTFSPLKWKDLELGVLEYRAVVKELPVIGLSTVLPLAGNALKITVYAPDPLEKEVREDFRHVIAGLTRTTTPWFTPAELKKIALLERIGMGGAAALGLYLLLWAVAFRGNPMRAHWIRTLWLAAAAVMFFVPISSPGPISAWSNLLVNAIAPLVLVMLVLRRVRMGLDID